MTTMLQAPVVNGAPYRIGDTVRVEAPHGCWNNATVQRVAHVPAQRFGCHWELVVTAHFGLTVRHVDDDGYTHTIGRRVAPSDLVGE